MVSVDIVLNDEASKVMLREDQLWKELGGKGYEDCLNRLDIPPYKPEWMLKDKFQSRCEECVTSGILERKNNKKDATKVKFRFCPNCGRLNK
jgi:ribosomal protein L33